MVLICDRHTYWGLALHDTMAMPHQAKIQENVTMNEWNDGKRSVWHQRFYALVQCLLI